MKVLHYIEKNDDKFGVSAKFVNMLSETMSPIVTSIIVTGFPSRRKFLDILYRNNPDIVHIHACWSWKASQIQRWCLSRGYIVVLSTHGGLMPNVLQTEFWKQKVPRLFAYQLGMVRHCSILLASSSKELKELKSLGWRKRIALVRNPYVVDDIKTEPQQCANDMRAVYKKMIDTKKRLHITAHEEQMFTLMLYAEIIKSTGMKIDDSPELNRFIENEHPDKHLSAMEWNDLLLCAKDRGMLDEILEGAKLMEITPATTNIEVPARFIPKFSLKIRTDDTADKKLDKNFPNMEKTDKNFLIKVYHLQRRLQKHRCETDKYNVWRELCDIFTFLRTADYNEPMLIEAAKKINIANFLRRIEQILSETLLLSSGFMLLDPIDDNMTDYLRKQIYLKP